MSNPRPLLLSVVLLAACSKDSGGKTASVELFGKRPTPPGDLAKVKAGMTQADVKALLPAAKPTPNHSGSPSLTIPSGYSNAEYRIGFYSDKDAVADVAVHVPKDLGEKVEKAWGPPTSKGHMGTTWINEEDGFEVRVNEMGRKTWIEYRPFVPLNAAFFGAKPGPVDVLTKVKLGMTRDEIAKAAPGFEKAGAPGGNGSYIPHDAAVKDVTISIRYDKDNKAEQFIVELPTRGSELLAKTWGPRPHKSRGLGSPMHCWDTADGVRVELADDRLTYTKPELSLCESI